MTLLLISRGSFSGGVHIANCLAESTRLTCLTREDLIAKVNTHGAIATKITESIRTAVQDYKRFSALRRPYKILTQLALLDYATQGDVAYFGYAGHLLLPDVPHVLKVRILAPLERRVALLRGREPLSEEQARIRIREVDDERARWSRFMYGKSLRDAELFDLLINLERISFKTACRILLHAARQHEFQPTAESLAILKARHLSARVLAALVTKSETSALELDAAVHDGGVTITGPYVEEQTRALVLSTAAAVSGVEHVDYQEGYPQSFALTA